MAGLALLERQMLDALEPRLTKDGYRLVRHPEARDLPPFLRNVAPDAVAVGRPPNLVIEVLANSGAARGSAESERVARLRSLLEGHPDWRLEVVYARSSNPIPMPAGPDEIRRRSKDVRKLSAAEPAGALLLAWSLFEAAVRRARPEDAALALTPGATIELVLSLGLLESSRAAALRKYGHSRNAIAHGDLSAELTTQDEVEDLLDWTEELLSQAEAEAAGRT